MPYKPIHGLSRTPLYKVWGAIVNRCCNPSDLHYDRYGGRGIRICAEWRHDPEAFCKWCLDHGYKRGLQIDRIDNDKGYSPDNCRFVSRKENLRNTSQNKRLTLHGETKNISAWSEKLGISYWCIAQRKLRGWSDEAALTTPVDSKMQRTTPPKRIVYRGESHTIREWSKITGVDSRTISSRLHDGWTEEKALTAPIEQQRQRLAPPLTIVSRGEKHTVKEWSKITGVNCGTIHSRLRSGWPPEKALSTRTIKTWIVCRGKRHTVTEWERISGIPRYAIYRRLKSGWPPDKIFSTPYCRTRRSSQP